MTQKGNCGVWLGDIGPTILSTVIGNSDNSANHFVTNLYGYHEDTIRDILHREISSVFANGSF